MATLADRNDRDIQGLRRYLCQIPMRSPSGSYQAHQVTSCYLEQRGSCFKQPTVLHFYQLLQRFVLMCFVLMYFRIGLVAWPFEFIIDATTFFVQLLREVSKSKKMDSLKGGFEHVFKRGSKSCYKKKLLQKWLQKVISKVVSKRTVGWAYDILKRREMGVSVVLVGERWVWV